MGDRCHKPMHPIGRRIGESEGILPDAPERKFINFEKRETVKQTLDQQKP
jgi:hypothetical protein